MVLNNFRHLRRRRKKRKKRKRERKRRIEKRKKRRSTEIFNSFEWVREKRFRVLVIVFENFGV